ncbi:MAG: M20 family metallopeptidase [Lachnospiraceae bacterium]|nr:M20 family metallopeptidase [Lachnospiraceae bacterium]
MEIQQLCNLIDTRKEELFDLLCKLIQINSESFATSGNEQACAQYIHEICKKIGLDSDIYSPMDLDGFEDHPDYWPGRNLKNRYNVTACWKGAEDRNALMLMGHIDTVEIGDISNWDFEPLAGVIKDGKILGRGACDDKYALATVIFLIKLLKDEGFKPKANLLFSAYCDEEYGGSHGALASVLRHPCPHIVSMDGREGQIWHCGSGGGEMKYMFHAKDTVDSAKLAASALPIVMEVVEKFAANRRRELEENRFYADTIIPETSLRYMGVRAGNNGMDLGNGEVYFVYYTDKTKDQIFAELTALERELEDRLAPLGIVGDGFKPQTRFFHYVFCEPDSEDIKNMLSVSKEVTGKEPIVCGSCLSDLSVISKYGSSKAYGFGIGRDFSKQGGAHQPNEYIECDKLVEYTKIIAAYILKILG